MTTATEVINRLSACGVTFQLEGIDGLRVHGVSRLSDQERATLKAHKVAILRALQNHAVANDHPAPAPALALDPEQPSTPCLVCGAGHFWHGKRWDSEAGFTLEGWCCSGCYPPPVGFQGDTIAVPAPGAPSPELSPARVICATCAHFQPDTVGDGHGIGRCAAGAYEQARAAWWSRIECLEVLRKTGQAVQLPDPPAPLYPGIERRCSEFQAQEGGQ